MSEIALQDKRQESALEEADLIWLFETYHKRIFNYIYYRVNNSSVAEDITSQVFEKVIRHRSLYRGQKAPIEVWLFAITKNCINDYLRSQKKRVWVPFENLMLIKSRERTPEEETLKDEEYTVLRQAINRLSEREINIIGLKYGGELSNVEIAEILGLSESNVGSILYRCMKKMKKEIEREDVRCIKRA